MSTPSSDSDQLTGEKPVAVFRLPLEWVDRINSWRAQYILLYVIWLAIQVYLYVQYVESEGAPMNVTLLAGSSVLIVLFFVRFIQVLRAMQYTFWMYVPACLLAILPIPGVLIVAYIDRAIAKALRRGLDAREALLQVRRGGADSAPGQGTEDGAAD